MKTFSVKLIKMLLSLLKKTKTNVEPTKPTPSEAPLPAKAAIPPTQSSKDQDDPPWLKAAYGELGIKELNGTFYNPRIVAYHMTTTLNKVEAESDETPWCSSFVNWCMEQSGRKGTDSAWARSWLKWGYPINIPYRGCIVVLSRGEKNGHVGFYISQTHSEILVLSGNQGNKVCEAYYPKARLLGYRWPKGKD